MRETLGIRLLLLLTNGAREQRMTRRRKVRVFLPRGDRQHFRPKYLIDHFH